MLFGAATAERRKSRKWGGGGKKKEKSHLFLLQHLFWHPFSPSIPPTLRCYLASTSVLLSLLAASLRGRRWEGERNKATYVVCTYEHEKVQNECVSPFIPASRGLNARRYNNVDVTKTIFYFYKVVVPRRTKQTLLFYGRSTKTTFFFCSVLLRRLLKLLVGPAKKERNPNVSHGCVKMANSFLSESGGDFQSFNLSSISAFFTSPLRWHLTLFDLFRQLGTLGTCVFSKHAVRQKGEKFLHASPRFCALQKPPPNTIVFALES